MRSLTNCLVVLAHFENVQGDAVRTARLLGAAEAAREKSGAVALRLGFEEILNETAIRAKERLSEEIFKTEWQVGYAMPLEQIVSIEHNQDLDRDEEEEPLRHSRGAAENVLRAQEGQGAASSGAALELNPLTRREQEVAALIAKGLSNRQIAEALVIAEGTAERHVANILSKLDFSSRAQVAAWAVKRGLAVSSSN